MDRSPTIQPNSSRFDFAIVAALPEELEAVKKVLGLKQVARNGRSYFHGEVRISGSRQAHFVVAARSREKGNQPAAQLANAVLTKWKPLRMLVVGIAGGVKKGNQISLGDVVAHDDLIYYESAKQSNGQELSRPMALEPPSSLLLDAVDLINDKHIRWWDRLEVARPDQKKRRPKLTRGLILTGEKLLGDPNSPTLKKLLAQHDKALAVEMESGGVSRAIWENGELRDVEFLAVRAISDYCDVKGNQKTRNLWKVYAANSAARAALAIIQNTPKRARQVQQKQARSGNPSPYHEYLKSFKRALEHFSPPSRISS